MTEKRVHGRGLRVIAAFKLLKALALVAVGVGALKLLHKDVAAIAEHWINVFQVDPHSHFIDLLLEKLAILDDRRLSGGARGRMFRVVHENRSPCCQREWTSRH